MPRNEILTQKQFRDSITIVVVASPPLWSIREEYDERNVLMVEMCCGWLSFEIALKTLCCCTPTAEIFPEIEFWRKNSSETVLLLF